MTRIVIEHTWENTINGGRINEQDFYNVEVSSDNEVAEKQKAKDLISAARRALRPGPPFSPVDELKFTINLENTLELYAAGFDWKDDAATVAIQTLAQAYIQLKNNSVPK